MKQLVLTGGIPKPRHDATAEKSEDENRPASLPDPMGQQAESILAQHVEAINEVTFPHERARWRPRRAEGHTVTDWGLFSEAFWSHSSDAPLRLIVKIAEYCGEVLDSICLAPRRMLRRDRCPERLDRVQQMDDACIRWFVRQPGRTILEKAGPRQRVLSVVRLETADTPENRVVHDFLRRCLREADIYLRENIRSPLAYAVKLVRCFRNRLRFWLMKSDVAGVPLPVGIPKANYVLQFDDRYSRIWNWYERLRRKQLYEDEAWRWQQRTWAEHTSLAVMHAASLLQQEAPYKGPIVLRMEQKYGMFVDARSAVGTWVLNRGGPLLLETILPQQLDGVVAPRRRRTVRSRS